MAGQGEPRFLPLSSPHADCTHFERAGYPLHGARINPEPLGDLTHARTPRVASAFLCAPLARERSEADRACFPRPWPALVPRGLVPESSPVPNARQNASAVSTPRSREL
jgi:hypothetical protein